LFCVCLTRTLHSLSNINADIGELWLATQIEYRTAEHLAFP